MTNTVMRMTTVLCCLVLVMCILLVGPLSAQTTVTPSTFQAGLAPSLTMTVSKPVSPTDPKQLVVTVGEYKAEIQRVQGSTVVFHAPAYVGGPGEYDVALFN